MTASYTPRQSSGASGPAYASAAPRPDPVPTASAGGPASNALKAAWNAYVGNFHGPLTPLTGQPDLNVLANRCGSIVRTGVDFLFGPVLKIQTKAGDDAQAILDAAWGDDDKRMTTLSKTRINGGVYGHCFVKLVTPKNKKPMSADNPPRIVVQNPELYTVETDPDDCELVTKYICTWTGTAEDGTPCLMRQTTTRIDPDDPDLDEGNNSNDPLESEQDADASWEIQNWTKAGGTGEEGAWLEVGEPIEWPYPFAPIVDWQNYPNPNDHWGARDVDDSVVNLNRQLHLVESNTNSVMYSHGHPWLFNTGDGDTGGITPTPGAITDVPGGNIQSITASGDIDHMMAFAAQIRADMDEASSTPGVATGRMAELPKGALSGITVRLLYGPRIMRTEHERRLYGQGIRAICRAVLILCGQETAAEDEVDVTWQDPLPQDDLAMAQMALALKQLGVSEHSIYALIGLNWDTEQDYKKTEAQVALDAYTKGQGMPPATMGMMPPTAPQGGQQGTVTQQPGQQNMPPTQHPAAVAQRNATKAVAAAMKSGATVKTPTKGGKTAKGA